LRQQGEWLKLKIAKLYENEKLKWNIDGWTLEDGRQEEV
jgi:hypothetical protein